MKKFILCAFAALATVCMTSCVTTTKTSKTENLNPELLVATAADLEIAPERITYTMVPSVEIRRGGDGNVKKAAIAEALLKAGNNYDLLVEPEFVMEKTNYFFFRKVSKITVSGRPAKYTNFRSLGDKVWTDPVFRNRPQYIVK